MYCYKCGKNINQMDSYCPYCGVPQAQQYSPIPPPLPPTPQQSAVTPQQSSAEVVSIDGVSGKVSTAHGFSEPMGKNQKFSIASIIYIIIILHGLIMLVIPSQRVYGGIYFGYLIINVPLRIISLIILAFVVIVLLTKKRGLLLIMVACALIVQSALSLVTQHIDMVTNLDSNLNLSFSFIQLIGLIPSLFMLVLAVCCDKKKSSSEKGIIPKLWFIPGIARTLFYALSLPSLFQLFRFFNLDSASYRKFIIDRLLSSELINLLYIAAAFSLGYWIFYINSKETRSM